MQLVKTKVLVHGYPVWIEVDSMRPEAVDIAVRRFEVIMKALTETNQVRGPF